MARTRAVGKFGGWLVGAGVFALPWVVADLPWTMGSSVYAADAAVAAEATARREAPTTPPTVTLTAAQVAEDLALLRRALEGVHPGLDRYSSAATRNAATTWLPSFGGRGATDAELYLDISRFLASIHCDHTKAELPEAIETWRQDHPSHLPFRFKLFDQRMFVAASDPRQTYLPRGTEILALNGLEIPVLLRSLSSFVAYDGRTQHVVPSKLAADSDLMGSDFDHFYWMEQAFPRQVEVRYRLDSGETKVGAFQLLPFREWRELPWETTPSGDFYDSVKFKLLGRRTAYLRVDTFVNYRHPVDPESFYRAFFTTLQDQAVEHLILDLRWNGGGSTDASHTLLQFLLDQPFRVTRSIRLKAVRYGDLPQFIETWGDPKQIFERPLEEFNVLPDGWFEERALEANEMLQPAPERFKGRLTVLIGPHNSSGATMILAKLKDAGRGVFLGEATGGSAEGPTAGQIFFLKLPHSKIRVRIPAKLSLTDIRSFEPGYGVFPDREIRSTLQDWMANRDGVLEAARSQP